MGKSGQLPAHVIIICDGMSNARINPVVQYAGNRENLGRPEIDRLVGSGKQFGKGTLATFLRNAVHAAKKNNSRIHLISLRPLSKGHGDPPANMSEFPPELADIFSLSHVKHLPTDPCPCGSRCSYSGTGDCRRLGCGGRPGGYDPVSGSYQASVPCHYTCDLSM